MRLFSSVLLAALAVASPAAAECAMAGVSLSARDGEVLPPDPTIWMFAEAGPYVSLDFEASRPVIEDVLETFGNLRVRRLQFRAAGGELFLRLTESPDRPVRFRVDPAWRRPPAPARGPWTVVEDAWTCSFTDALVSELDGDAPAFEVVGPGVRAVLPPRIGDLFGGRPSARPARLVAGHASCFGWTVGDARRPEGALDVHALYPDGSRVPVSAAAALEPVGPFLAPPDPGPTRHLALRTEDPRWRLAAWALPGLLALLLLAGVVVARRRAVWP